MKNARLSFRFWITCFSLWMLLAIRPVHASENVPHRPFAQLADVPNQRQFVAGVVYEQAQADNAWFSGQKQSLGGGMDVYQGFLALQYGITPRWAADLNVGYTRASFGSDTSGLMDIGFGVRYQIFREDLAESAWLPTLTFRAGAVLPGSFDQYFPFSPGLRSAAIEPELLLRKHFAWEGFGSYADALYRWNKTTGTDQYIIALGLFQQFKGFELDLGWRHLQTLSGSDIVFNPDGTISYPRDPRENSDAIEAGISYTTAQRHFRYAVHTRAVIDGTNTDDKFWFGLSVDFSFGGNPAPATGP
jgi:hypothetical protein